MQRAQVQLLVRELSSHKLFSMAKKSGGWGRWGAGRTTTLGGFNNLLDASNNRLIELEDTEIKMIQIKTKRRKKGMSGEKASWANMKDLR